MSTFIQLHLLTSYPPSNLNRDDLGRPKTVVMGGRNRLRISSQSLKRAWRTSDLIATAMNGHIGTRTKKIGKEMILAELPPDSPEAGHWAEDTLRVYGEPDEEPGTLSQLVFISPAEEAALKDFTRAVKAFLSGSEDNGIIKQVSLLHEGRAKKNKEDERSKITKQIVSILRKHLLIDKVTSAFDIAMFGRMLASSPGYDIEAAVQVAHAVTVHEAAVEDDYFTAVDDLNNGDENSGAAHIGETEFAAGLFYLYLCINRDLLVKNLGDDRDLAYRALSALTEVACKVAPTGKQNSFASRAYASYLLAERGEQQPRSLSVAFLKPVRGEDILAKAIAAIEETRSKMESIYGPCADNKKEMNASTGSGSLEEVIAFVKE